MSTRRGGIPGPESRTGLTRPIMSEAEFERRVAASGVDALMGGDDADPIGSTGTASGTIAGGSGSTGTASGTLAMGIASGTQATQEPEPTIIRSSTGTTRTRSARVKPAAKPKRVQRMFAIEEDLDRKLWLYAIHLGKDRSDVVNDLLRPVVASMVLYDSRDRRASASRSVESSEGELAEAG